MKKKYCQILNFRIETDYNLLYFLLILFPAPPPAADPIIPEAPQNLATEPMTTSATVSWDAPVDNGAEITGYKLAYGTSDNPTANTATVGPSPTQTVLEGLMGNTQYSVSVVAYNADGDGPLVSADFQTTEGKF